jgi:hypothetical protein
MPVNKKHRDLFIVAFCIGAVVYGMSKSIITSALAGIIIGYGLMNSPLFKGEGYFDD